MEFAGGHLHGAPEREYQQIKLEKIEGPTI